MPRVVIIGGGITGLSSAYYVERMAKDAGLEAEVTLVERDSRLGGKIGTDRIGRFVVEWAPDSFVTYKPWGVRLCREIGVREGAADSDAELVQPSIHGFYMLIGGKLHKMPEELIGLTLSTLKGVWRAPFLTLGGKVRASVEGIVRPRRRLKDESLAGFMRRRFGCEFAKKFAEPLMAGIYAGQPENLSMAAIYPTYFEMEKKYGSMSRAIVEMSRRRQVEKTAAKTGEMNPKGSAFFVSIRGGMEVMVDRLTENLASTDVRVGTSVESIASQVDGLYYLALSSGDRLSADAILLATPAYVASELLKPLAPAAADELAKIPYASTAVVSLAYGREDVGHALNGSGFLVARDEPFPVSGCTWTSSKWERRAPEGSVLVRAFMGFSGAGPNVEEASEDELAKAAHAALAPVLDIKGKPILAKTYRWLRAMPQYEVGHVERLAKIEAGLAAHPNVVLAGAAYRGVGVPDCVRQAKDAAEKVVGFLRARKGGEPE
jgi:oxygen-dependent protoporphyrinogen oxidase